ncbi:hypothetical protein KM043_002421 [Ampulex compressa]|nr:hypothetical protein KM043_002421 [Ampulex compressa]
MFARLVRPTPARRLHIVSEKPPGGFPPGHERRSYGRERRRSPSRSRAVWRTMILLGPPAAAGILKRRRLSALRVIARARATRSNATEEMTDVAVDNPGMSMAIGEKGLDIGGPWWVYGGKCWKKWKAKE